MALAEGNINSSGLPMFHLKRIGPAPTKNQVVIIMDFYEGKCRIGRCADEVDFYIDSNNVIQSAMISSVHARIERDDKNQHHIYDESSKGVFVNDVKIAGSYMLQDGDTVIFGHPYGEKLPPESKERQWDSEHQFMMGDDVTTWKIRVE